MAAAPTGERVFRMMNIKKMEKPTTTAKRKTTKAHTNNKGIVFAIVLL